MMAAHLLAADMDAEPRKPMGDIDAISHTTNYGRSLRLATVVRVTGVSVRSLRSGDYDVYGAKQLFAVLPARLSLDLSRQSDEAAELEQHVGRSNLRWIVIIDPDTSP